MRIAILGVPLDLGAAQRGMDGGPSAIRLAGLNSRLQGIGFKVVDSGNISVFQREALEIGDTRLRYLDPIRAVAEKLITALEDIHEDTVPVVLGGDHSISLGSVSASARRYGKIGLLWIDAHADFNTDKTSPTGNIHGMVLAALAGAGDPRLTNLLENTPIVDPKRIAILGARNFDPEERVLLRQNGVNIFTMADIQKQGLKDVTLEAIDIITKDDVPLHVSFDIDALDPREAPGVGAPVSGGLTMREALFMTSLIAENGSMKALDLVEVAPILDHSNQTGRLAVDLICSAFGEQIFRGSEQLSYSAT